MQLRKEPVETLHNEKHYSKENISARTKSQDKKFPSVFVNGIQLISQSSRLCEERRSAHNIFEDCLCSFLGELPGYVVLHTKTVTNHLGFF